MKCCMVGRKDVIAYAAMSESGNGCSYLILAGSCLVGEGQVLSTSRCSAGGQDYDAGCGNIQITSSSSDLCNGLDGPPASELLPCRGVAR